MLAVTICRAIVHSQLGDVAGCMAAGGLTGVLPYGPQVADHCLLEAGLQPQARIADAPLSPERQAALLSVVARFQEWVASLDAAPPPGYIGLARPGQFLPSAGRRLPCALCRLSNFTSRTICKPHLFRLPAMAKPERSGLVSECSLSKKIGILRVLNHMTTERW